jgi:hypothetical protein
MNIFLELQGGARPKGHLLFKGSKELTVTTMRYAGLASIFKLIREPFCRRHIATPRAVTLRNGLEYYGVSL